MTVAQKFNDFFTTVASTLVSKLPKPSGLFGMNHVRNFYSDKVAQDSFKLNPVDKDQVLKIINNLGSEKATGIDGLPVRFIKDGANQISNPLTHIINLSLQQGIVPNDLKCARVVPLHKKGDRTNEGNYRP